MSSIAGRIKDAHRILYRLCMMSPTKALVQDPCPLGFSEVLVVAQMGLEELSKAELEEASQRTESTELPSPLAAARA